MEILDLQRAGNLSSWITMQRKYWSLLWIILFILWLLWGWLFLLYSLDKSLCETDGSILSKGEENQIFLGETNSFKKYLFAWDRVKVYFIPSFLGLQFSEIYTPSGDKMSFTGSEVTLKNLTESWNYTFIFNGIPQNYTGDITIYFEDIPFCSF